MLTRVIEETESAINYQDYYITHGNKHLNTAQAISHAACSVAYDQDIKILITMTHSGSTARMVSRYRPAARIIAMTPIKEISRQLSIVWGITAIVINEYDSSREAQEIVNTVLSSGKILKEGEKYVITGGVPVGVPGTTNYLSVFKFV